jgi:hypothetical protein
MPLLDNCPSKLLRGSRECVAVPPIYGAQGLHEAITYAVTLQDKQGKVPWIKTGEQILTPKQITMGDVGTFGSKT